MTKEKRKNLIWGIVGIVAGAFWYNILSKAMNWNSPAVDSLLLLFLVIIPLAGGLMNMFKFFEKDKKQ